MKTKYKNKELQKALSFNMPSLILCIILSIFMMLCFGLSLFNTAREIVNGSEHGFIYILCHDHPISLAFGIVLLYWICVWDLFAESLYALRSLRPACGNPRFSVAEIDAQADHPDTVWFPACAVYAAPDMIIGTNCGTTAVTYSDIAKVRITSRTYSRLRGYVTLFPLFQKHHYREFTVYTLTVTTKDHKRLYISKGTATADLPKLKALLLKKCGSDLVWEDSK